MPGAAMACNDGQDNGRDHSDHDVCVYLALLGAWTGSPDRDSSSHARSASSAVWPIGLGLGVRGFRPTNFEAVGPGELRR